MPRSGVNGTYSLPPNTNNQAPNTPISSSMFNAFASDVQQTFNDPTPIAYGGTGAATAAAAATALEVVSYAAQTLSDPQKGQALTNIGAIAKDIDQSSGYTTTQKVNILKNTLQAWEIVPGGVVSLASDAANVTWSGLGAYRCLRLLAMTSSTTDDTSFMFRAGQGSPDTSSVYRAETLTADGTSVIANPVVAQSAGYLASGTTVAGFLTMVSAVFMDFNIARTMRYTSLIGTTTTAANQRAALFAGAHGSGTARDVIQVYPLLGDLVAGSYFVLEGLRG